MNVLLLYPEFPTTYWGLHHALPFTGRKALMPPLGLITIAAMLPGECQPRLVDLNCDVLTDEDIAWADVVFISAMLHQKVKTFEVAARCRAFRKPIVMGGPYPTLSPDECEPWCDTLVLGEAEAVWDTFADDLVHHRLQSRYASEDKPDVTRTPVPRFDLLNVDDYQIIPLQFSRGCPFQCEFCDIIVMFGRRPRTKTPEQMIRELEALKRTGHRGEIYIVDDNFIGNKKAVKQFLPVLTEWNNANTESFELWAEVSVDLADDEDLMARMVAAGFRSVFVGIETPSREGLKETLKFQNLRRPLDASVRKIFAAGMHVAAGFIIGFDTDTEDIFDRQIDFISSAAIPYAMVGLLFALNGTPLFDRMKASGRLLEWSTESDPDNFGYTNIRTILPRRTLIEGYRRVVDTLYRPDPYFGRAFESLIRMKRPASFQEGVINTLRGIHRAVGSMTSRKRGRDGVDRRAISAVRRSSALLTSLPNDFRKAARHFLWRVIRTRPDQIYMALQLVVFGYHMHKFTIDRVLPYVDAHLAKLAPEPVQEVPILSRAG